MLEPDSISRTLAAHRAELQRFQVRELWLFGSVARGEVEARDVDLLVEFTKAPSLVGFIELKQYLESVLGVPVDLVSKGACKERFLREIATDLRHVA